MISLILVFFAGIFNGICDTLVSEPQFKASIFSSFKNQQWWNWFISGSNKHRFAGPTIWNKLLDLCFTTFLVFTTDAWHLFKVTFVFLFLLAIFIYHPLFTAQYLNFYYLDFIGFNFAFGLGWQCIQPLIKK